MLHAAAWAAATVTALTMATGIAVAVDARQDSYIVAEARALPTADGFVVLLPGVGRAHGTTTPPADIGYAAPAPASTTPPAPAPTTQAPAPAAPAYGAVDQQVLDLVNAERAAAGCVAVSLDAALTAAADAHAQDMKNQNYFSHASLDGRTAFDRMRAASYSYSTAAENIARGQRDAAAVMKTWMASPDHRSNVLNCAFQDLGVGYEEGSGGPWWVQNFGA